MAVRRYKKTSPYKKYGKMALMAGGAYAAQRYGGPTGFKTMVDDIAYVKNRLNSEFKFYDRSLTDLPDNATGTIRSLNIMSQGDGGSQRDGISVKNKSIFIQGRAILNLGGGANTASVIRMAIVYDRHPQGGLPVYSAAAGSDAIYDAASVDAWRRLDCRKRFVVLATKKIVLNTDYPEKTFILKKRLNFKTDYYAGITSGTSAAVAAGGLFFICFSDESTHTPGVEYRTRLRYVDN